MSLSGLPELVSGTGISQNKCAKVTKSPTQAVGNRQKVQKASESREKSVKVRRDGIWRFCAKVIKDCSLRRYSGPGCPSREEESWLLLVPRVVRSWRKVEFLVICRRVLRETEESAESGDSRGYARAKNRNPRNPAFSR